MFYKKIYISVRSKGFMAMANDGVNLCGKRLVVIFLDGADDHISRKEGTLQGYDVSFVQLRTDSFKLHLIPICRIIRAEVLEGEDDKPPLALGVWTGESSHG